MGWSQLWLIQENVGPSASALAVSGSPGFDCDPCPFTAQAKRKSAVNGSAASGSASRPRLKIDRP